MELYHLKTFVKVAQEGNLTRASAALFTSQPAISAQIKALEEETGVQLFSRTPKGMLLTPAGQRLFEQAQRTLREAEQFVQQAMQLSDELVGELRIGIHTDFEFMRVGDLFRLLSSRHPQLVAHFLQTSTAKVFQELRQNQVDAGFTFGPCAAADMQVTELAQVPMRILAPSSWEERIRGRSLAELTQLPWVYTTPNCPFYKLFEALFRHGEQPPSEIVWCDTEDAIRALIRSGVGMSVVREDDAAAAEKQGYGICWPGEVPEIALNLVMLKQRSNEVALQALATGVHGLWLDDSGHEETGHEGTGQEGANQEQSEPAAEVVAKRAPV
ncbi:LysR family transcriptional regulator [Marinobacterium lutimaris]|uniref:DNA-binding transcriptional regulator, LysR family n=1 Tax=Marinobacterium lutimaris TaxID=568106 RepID=A0A1H5X725_9GAMM|nr:LysR family transcriptional regulator [Marinobacterium lutimaris]SEG07549.1 DNA-binding transcriptional regulator, LysR family [Marinobacterium lutimaris]